MFYDHIPDGPQYDLTFWDYAAILIVCVGLPLLMWWGAQK